MFGDNLTRRFATLSDAFYSPVAPTPLPNPKLAAFSPDCAHMLGLPEGCEATPDFIQTFSGADASNSYKTLSTVYSGHQFGYYVPQLGDGRAHLIAEINTPSNGIHEVQLKGSGKTPYSRFGDGRAVLRSCIREFLASEAMAALGIPTTRALCIIASDEPVRRETIEHAACLTRVSPSHIRFGSFEYFFHTQQYDALRELADFTIQHYFPEAQQADKPYAAWFKAVVTRTAKLIAQWQCVGFCHGVMNTDNMSILGLTLDYGPYGFLDNFNAHHICNHSDEHGRYAYDQQPLVAMWNLNALAYALSPLISDADLKAGLHHYEPTFLHHYEGGMRAKLGLTTTAEEDGTLIHNLLKILHEDKIDYSIFFRNLDGINSSDDSSSIRGWKQQYAERLEAEKSDPAERRKAMDGVNPKYILRNYLAEQAIQKAEAGDYSEIETLRAILSRPFDEQPEHDAYSAPPPDWAAGICISCSS
jgi:serine/tyrosine/threonine adenylyltransferase